MRIVYFLEGRMIMEELGGGDRWMVIPPRERRFAGMKLPVAKCTDLGYAYYDDPAVFEERWDPKKYRRGDYIRVALPFK